VAPSPQAAHCRPWRAETPGCRRATRSSSSGHTALPARSRGPGREMIRILPPRPRRSLTASYELLTRQVRRSAADMGTQNPRQPQRRRPARAGHKPAGGLRLVSQQQRDGSGQRAGSDLARQACRWALASRDERGALPSGRAISRAHDRKVRWGRLVKRAGLWGSKRAPSTLTWAFTNGSLAFHAARSYSWISSPRT
jgi:hypothetical protein